MDGEGDVGENQYGAEAPNCRDMEGTPAHVLFRPFHNPLSLAIFFLHRRDGVRCAVQIVLEVVLVQVGFL